MQAVMTMWTRASQRQCVMLVVVVVEAEVLVVIAVVVVVVETSSPVIPIMLNFVLLLPN
jgi:hypothetical protein